MQTAFVNGADLLHNVRVQYKLPPERFADGLFGDVVVSGAKSARGDDDVGAVPGQFDGLPYPPGVVPYDRMPVDVNPETR